MIQKYYEITCDYCRAGIEHGIGNKESSIQIALSFGMFMKNKHHFCNEKCYNNWLNNGKQNFLSKKD